LCSCPRKPWRCSLLNSLQYPGTVISLSIYEELKVGALLPTRTSNLGGGTRSLALTSSTAFRSSGGFLCSACIAYFSTSIASLRSIGFDRSCSVFWSDFFLAASFIWSTISSMKLLRRTSSVYFLRSSAARPGSGVL